VIKPRRQSPPPRCTGSDPGAPPQKERGTRDKTSSVITSPAAFYGNLCCVREVHVIKPRQPSPPPRRTATILAPSPSLPHSSPVPRTLGRTPSPLAATSAFRSPLPTYSGPRPNPGHIAEGRASLLGRDQERLLQCRPPRAATPAYPKPVRNQVCLAGGGGRSCQAMRHWALTPIH